MNKIGKLSRITLCLSPIFCLSFSMIFFCTVVSFTFIYSFTLFGRKYNFIFFLINFMFFFCSSLFILYFVKKKTKNFVLFLGLFYTYSVVFGRETCTKTHKYTKIPQKKTIRHHSLITVQKNHQITLYAIDHRWPNHIEKKSKLICWAKRDYVPVAHKILSSGKY